MKWKPILHFREGEWECPKCGRRFPTHYRVVKGYLRRQLGRRYVTSLPNVMRHIEACRYESK